MTETVNQPDHYNHGGELALVNGKEQAPMSTITYVEQLLQDTGVSYSQVEAIHVFSVIKYLSRFPFKALELHQDPSKRVEDLEKAQWYLNRLASVQPASELKPISDTDNVTALNSGFVLKNNSAMVLTDGYLQGLLDGTFFTGTEAYYVSALIKGLTTLGMQAKESRADYLTFLTSAMSDLIVYEKAYVEKLMTPASTTTKAPETTTTTAIPVETTTTVDKAPEASTTTETTKEPEGVSDGDFITPLPD